RLRLTAGPRAAGGSCVSRHVGRVVFVRGTTPGETITARLLEDPAEKADARFWRAETIDVLEAGVDRVPTIWPEAGVDGVGGAEWPTSPRRPRGRYAPGAMQDLFGRAGVPRILPDRARAGPPLLAVAAGGGAPGWGGPADPRAGSGGGDGTCRDRGGRCDRPLGRTRLGRADRPGTGPRLCRDPRELGRCGRRSAHGPRTGPAARGRHGARAGRGAPV